MGGAQEKGAVCEWWDLQPSGGPGEAGNHRAACHMGEETLARRGPLGLPLHPQRSTQGMPSPLTRPTEERYLTSVHSTPGSCWPCLALSWVPLQREAKAESTPCKAAGDPDNGRGG